MSEELGEIKILFDKLNQFVVDARRLAEIVKEDWQREYTQTFVSSEVASLLREIAFFQIKYNIDVKNIKNQNS